MELRLPLCVLYIHNILLNILKIYDKQKRKKERTNINNIKEITLGHKLGTTSFSL